MYVCSVCMAGYPSVSCNRIIENKRNKTKKKKKKKKKKGPTPLLSSSSSSLSSLSEPSSSLSSSNTAILLNLPSSVLTNLVFFSPLKKKTIIYCFLFELMLDSAVNNFHQVGMFPLLNQFCSNQKMKRRETGLSSPVKYFTGNSKAVLLLWIICVIYVLSLSYFQVCSLLPCGHLLGKG